MPSARRAHSGRRSGRPGRRRSLEGLGGSRARRDHLYSRCSRAPRGSQGPGSDRTPRPALARLRSMVEKAGRQTCRQAGRQAKR